MKSILIDGKVLYDKHCGIKTYALNLSNELINLSRENDIKIKFIHFSGMISESCDSISSERLINKAKQSMGSIKKYIPEDSFFYKKMKKYYIFVRNGLKNMINLYNIKKGINKNYDIFWTPYQLEINTQIAKKKFITVHDIFPLTHPETFISEHALAFKKYIEDYLPLFDGIITDSNFTKNDISNYLNVPMDKIHTVYCGIDRDFFKKIYDNAAIESFKAKYNIKKPFLLFVGAIQPRKNLATLLKAYKELNISKDFDLIMISNVSWLAGDVFALINELSPNVKVYREIGDEELVLFYNAAELMVFPSIAEGFGIPLLEAFSCGCPVAASNVTSIPEVCGDAAAYFDPYSIEEMKEAIMRVLTDDVLRKELIAKGFKRAENFSWKVSAQRLLDIFLEKAS